MAKKTSGKHPWVFSEGRRTALKRAQKTHVYLVELGKRARARGMK